MMRLKRVYETAEEEGTPVEKLAMERFGSLEAFEEAKEERRILDERQGRRSSGGSGGGHGERGRVQEQRSGGGGGEKRLMFNDIGGSGGSSRSSSFRRPGAMGERQQSAPGTPSTPSPPSGAAPPANRRLDSLRLPSQAGSPLAQSHTPIPSVMTPQPLAVRKGGKRGLSPSSLNRLQAKVLRAKLMGAPDADKLEKEYEVEARRAAGGGGGGGDDDEVRVRLGEGRDDDDMDVDGDREDLDVDARGGVVRRKVEVLPTLDGRGRLYDVGHGKEDDRAQGPGNRKKKEKVRVGIFLLSCVAVRGRHRLTRVRICSSKHMIPRQVRLSGTTQTTTRQRLGRCCGRRGLERVWPTRRIWMLSSRVQSWAMGSSR